MSREIQIEADWSCPPNLREACGRFKLIPNALPIERVTVEHGEYGVIIRVDTRMLDVQTGVPKLVKFGRAFGRELNYLVGKSREGALGDALRSTLQYAMNHEIDEVLMLDGDHFTDPHPGKP
jgi:hypothetical protein